ncbi:DNA binding domain-containing protein, excisionase family [Clostridium cavendishii DSM 21758]|uniref:DNA binding domain-containing protein, excisionase family n=1 Tax=Clostridium cavendishii DSM 21758 TaxID=1121302 RepID=A0A1M6NV78_9CLOT|nr:excisionase [Clostridium cavendishii]SHJ99538.1 DNA binding domain-containing protein, excisionase family [Clostridium cavendishii DSM 21758]
MEEKLLQEILTEIKSSKKVTLTVAECSELMNISKDKIRELVNKVDTDFPFFKVGVKVLINKDMLDNWLEKISKEHREL